MSSNGDTRQANITSWKPRGQPGYRAYRFTAVCVVVHLSRFAFRPGVYDCAAVGACDVPGEERPGEVGRGKIVV